MVLRVAGLFAACLLLPTCHRRPPADEPLEHMRVDDGQKARAIDATNQFREIFNNSDCLPIYDKAAANFRTQDSQDWERECERLKELGSWRSFQITDTERCAAPEVVVCVIGPAEFEKGQTEIGIAWLLGKDGARLFWLAIKEDEWHWRQIPPIPFGHRWIDPPRMKSPKDSLAS